AVGGGRRAALYRVARGADLREPVCGGVGQGPFAQVEELPRRRRTEEDGDQCEHGASLSASSDVAGFPGFTAAGGRRTARRTSRAPAEFPRARWLLPFAPLLAATSASSCAAGSARA